MCSAGINVNGPVELGKLRPCGMGGAGGFSAAGRERWQMCSQAERAGRELSTIRGSRTESIVLYWRNEQWTVNSWILLTGRCRIVLLSLLVDRTVQNPNNEVTFCSNNVGQ